MRQVAALTLLSSVLFGQALDLRTALQQAAVRHPLLRSVGYAVPLAQADSLSASLWVNPTAQLQYTQVPSQLGAPGGLGPAYGQWQLSTMQTLDLAGLRQRRLELARQGITVAGESYNTALQQVLAEVALRWIDLWSAERSLAIARRAVTSVDSLVAINRVRLRGQAIVPADVWRAEMLASQYRIQQVQLEQQRRIAQRWLQYALARTDSLWTSEAMPDIPIEELPVQAWIERALLHRADYRLAVATVLAAEANVQLQDALGIPNPDVGIIATQQQNVPFVGVGITYPLPLVNRNQGERQKARIAVEQARADQQRLRAQIVAEVTVAYEQYQTARAALTQAQTVLAKAGDVLSTIQLAYLKGATLIVDLLDAQRSWYETQRSYYDALADYGRAAIQLLISCGELSNLLQR
ncbi:MAG: TolC family protein [Candidatus Kapabacteria bacterium]|nr:TolC family protein [Candidatus Kapabacteria bacterium]